MAPPVITITRQYASGGSEVARLVAAELRWDVIDNEFVDEVARRVGLPPDAVAQREERTAGLLERLARTLAAGSPEMFIAIAASSGSTRGTPAVARPHRPGGPGRPDGARTAARRAARVHRR